MNLKDLVGKHVYRKEPIKRMSAGTFLTPATEIYDRSYMSILTGDEKRVCIDFVDGVAIIQTTDRILGDHISTIDVDYNDDHWMDATDVYEKVAKYNEELKAKKYAQYQTESSLCEDSGSEESKPVQQPTWQ